MYNTPPNIKKSLSEFMADLDAGAASSDEAKDDIAWLEAASGKTDENFDDIEVSAAFRPLRRSTDAVSNDSLASWPTAAPEETDLSFDDDDYETVWTTSQPAAQDVDEANFASEESERLEDPILFASLGGALDDDDTGDALADVMAAPAGNTISLMMIAATLVVLVCSAVFLVQNSQSPGSGFFSDAALAIDRTANSAEPHIVPATTRTLE